MPPVLILLGALEFSVSYGLWLGKRWSLTLAKGLARFTIACVVVAFGVSAILADSPIGAGTGLFIVGTGFSPALLSFLPYGEFSFDRIIVLFVLMAMFAVAMSWVILSQVGIVSGPKTHEAQQLA